MVVSAPIVAVQGDYYRVTTDGGITWSGWFSLRLEPLNRDVAEILRSKLPGLIPDGLGGFESTDRR